MTDDKSLSELMKTFVEELIWYLKRRGRDTVAYILIQPLQQAGAKLVLLLAATALIILGAVFLGMFAVLGFTYLFGGSYLMGYLCAGVLVLIIAAAVLLASSRREGSEPQGKEATHDDHAGGGTRKTDHDA